jgi:hypothetical protein
MGAVGKLAFFSLSCSSFSVGKYLVRSFNKAKEPERDNATLTVGRVCRAPKNIAKVVFFYVVLMLFRIILTAMIRINAVTIMNFDFHCRATELLHMTEAVLSMKDAR